MAANRKLRLLLVLTVAMGLIVMFALMGQYERQRRVDREAEYRDKLTALSAELPDMERLRRLVMVYEDRAQPLDSVARGKLRQMSGKRKLYGADPVLTLLSMAFDGKDFWYDVPCMLIQHGRNKDWAGVHSADRLVSWRQVKESEQIQKRAKELAETADEAARPVPVDQEILQLVGHVRELENRFYHLFNVIPPSQEQKLSDSKTQDDWHLPHRGGEVGHPRGEARAAEDAFKALAAAWTGGDDGSRDMAAVDAACADLDAKCRALGPQFFPDDAKIEAELRLNRTNPFANASWFCAAAAFLALFGMSFGARWLRFGSLGTLTVALALLLYGFYMRTTLGFGVSITNLTESMLASATATVLICLLIDSFRGSWWGTIAGGMGAFFVLQWVDLNTVKFEDTIGGTIAVLANNIWIHIHVPVIMSAYAAFFIAFLLSCISLPWTLLFDRKGRAPELRSLLKTSDVAMNLGVVLCGIGIALGAKWADVSWGRWWGWDPKETWAAILFLYYLVIVHGRFTKWMSPLWTSWMMFFGGNMLLWTYYGTNELLSGLHSYANSSGGNGFMDNLVHARNRWFVVTSGTLFGVAILTAVTARLFTPEEVAPDGTAEETGPEGPDEGALAAPAPAASAKKPQST